MKSSTNNKKKQTTKSAKTTTKKKKLKLKKINNIRFHISYYFRIFIYVVLLIAFLYVGYSLIKNSVSFVKEQKISYIEKSNLGYKVYLKENDFYESDYLDKNMSYIASLIDYIDLDFYYNFTIDHPINGEFNYKIVAVLNINDEKSKGTFYTKEFTLLDNQVRQVAGDEIINIYENVKLDYDYYNILANKFKATYGVGATSDLKVYLKVNRNINSDLIGDRMLDDTNSMFLNIPLSQKAININMNYDEINNHDNIISTSKLKIDNIIYFVTGLIVCGLNIVIFIDLVRNLQLLSSKNSSYDKYVNKILKEYDRLIVITETMPKLDKFQVFKLKTFGELLDVRDNTKQPIMYYNVTDHIKCYFYLKHNDDIYLLCIKAVDMVKKTKR